MVQENNASQQLYDLLVTRDFDPESLDSMGKPTVNPSEADLFSFNFSANGNEYGTVVILVNGDNDLELFYGDNLGRGMDAGDKGDWYDFLAVVRNLAKRHLLTFSLNNMNKLKYQMKSMAELSEGLVLEAWKGQGKNKSYNKQPGNAKVVIQHSRAIGEGEQRFRNIGALFVENAQGERFKMPFRSIGGAKAMARHVSEGGTPYDSFGQYISEIVNEINTLGKFIRASRGNQFAQNQQALSIVEDAVKHYADLKRKAKKMIGKRGYKEIFSTYDPMVVTELDETIESVREVFVNSAVDSRIEEALPILAKIKESTMKEANQFENWTNQIMEGTWALPETAEDMARLQELMSKPLPCGPDGEYASEQLYDLIGDDSLFDDIGELADKDPDADCRKLVMARAQELGIDNIEFTDDPASMSMKDDGKLGYDESVSESPTQEEPASEYQAGQAAAAAGKERSLEMGMGDEDVVKTAGGSDVEEGMDSFVNPMDQDGTDNEKAVDPMAQDDLDSEDMTEDENFDIRTKLSPQQIANAENYDLDIDEMSMDTWEDLNKDPMSIKDDIEGEIYGFLEDAVRDNAVPVDDVYYDFNDYRDEVILFGGDKVEKAFFGVRGIDDEDDVEGFIEACRVALADLGKIVRNDELQAMKEMADMRRLSGQVNEAKSPPEVINPTKDSSPADLKAAIKYAKYMKAKMDTDKAKATYDKEIAQLQGWMNAKSVTKETQDIDTGKEALKAERDPMLERILHLAKG